MTTPADLMPPAQSGRMSDHLVRVLNLKAHQRKHGWDDSELARQCGRSPQQIYAWFNGEGSVGRKIGEKLARSLEERLKLQRYSLDDRIGIPQAAELQPKWGDGAAASITVTRRTRELPIVQWEQINNLLLTENAELKLRAPHLETFAPSSTRAKFIEMPDDSMAPDFGVGDHLLLDPLEAPRAGDVVLLRLVTGEYLVRLFKPRTAHAFDAVPINQMYAAIDASAAQAEVMGVMVEHRRYRRHA